MTAVPAISPAGNQGVVRHSREGGGPGGETQYSDLGSSYKSGVVSGPDSAHLMGGNNLGKMAVGSAQMQQ